MGRKRRLPGLTIKDGYMRHPFDIQNHVETSGLVHGRDLTTGHAHDRHTTAYYGIAPSVLTQLCARWARPAANSRGGRIQLHRSRSGEWAGDADGLTDALSRG